MFQENGIDVSGLLAHTWNALHHWDLSVFGPLKEAFKRLLNRRAVSKTNQSSTENDAFTVCEPLCIAYEECVTARNVMAGFRKVLFCQIYYSVMTQLIVTKGTSHLRQ